VQNVSNLIVHANIAVPGAGTRTLLAGANLDRRGHTHDSRSRALDYPVTNRLLGPGAL
jgi:hypothetical protein